MIIIDANRKKTPKKKTPKYYLHINIASANLLITIGCLAYDSISAIFDAQRSIYGCIFCQYAESVSTFSIIIILLLMNRERRSNGVSLSGVSSSSVSSSSVSSSSVSSGTVSLLWILWAIVIFSSPYYAIYYQCGKKWNARRFISVLNFVIILIIPSAVLIYQRSPKGKKNVTTRRASVIVMEVEESERTPTKETDETLISGKF